MKVPQTPPLTLSEQFTATPDSEAAGGVVQPSLSIFLAFLPEVKAQSLWGDLFAVCLLIADIAMGGHGSVTAAVFAVGCIHQTRRFGIQD